MITPLFPAAAASDAHNLLAELARFDLQYADPRMLDFMDALGQQLRQPAVARLYPELGALGAWLRRGALSTRLAALACAPDQLRYAQGLVFHIAPGNADTVFMYTWALAALAGNQNVVRISQRAGAATHALLALLNAQLAQAHPVIAATQRIVQYAHTETTSTAAFSAACNLRVLWGGDNAINQIRQWPLAPGARDLTFPNRSSFAVMAAPAFLALSPAARQHCAEALHTDIYLFGQAACASPGTLFWVGDAASALAAQTALTPLLARTAAERGPQADAAMAIEKYVASYGLAAEGSVDAIHFVGNELALLNLSPPAQPPRRWLGTGTLAVARLDSLDELAALLQRGDQTLAYAGFSVAEMLAFARHTAGRGIDRIVPLGHALDFAVVWDGHDLLHEFTRLVSVH